MSALSGVTYRLRVGRMLPAIIKYEKPFVWVVALFFITMGIAIVLQRNFITGLPVLTDLAVYAAAVKAYSLGLDPYDTAVLHSLGAWSWHNFTSPPAVAMLFRLIAEAGLEPIFRPLFLVLHFTAYVAIPLALGRIFFGATADRLMLAVAAALIIYEPSGTITIQTANNGTLLYCLIAITAVSGFKMKRWGSFLIAVFIATIFKPFYLAYLVLPALAHEFSWRRAIHGFAVGVAAVAVHALFAVFDPVNFHSWLSRLADQTARDIADHAVGLNIYNGLLSAIPGISNAKATMFQLIYILALAGVFFLTNPSGKLRWAFLLGAAVFANPRLLYYDESFASIPLVFAAATVFPGWLPTGVRLASAVVLLTPVLLVPTYRTVALIPSSLLFPLATLTIFTWAAVAQRRRTSAASVLPGGGICAATLDARRDEPKKHS